MRKEKIALHLGRNATSVINEIISPPCANLGIIVAINPENRSQAERKKKRIKKTTADHAEFTSSDDEFFSRAAEHLAQAKKISLQDPVTWYGINYTGTQMTQWDFQNKRNSYQSSVTFLCFESPTASFASQCSLFRTM